MTFVEKFEQIKKKYGKLDTSRVTEDFAVQVTLTDEDCGGTFFVACLGGEAAVEPYDYVDNTASVCISAKDMIDAIGGKLDVVAAIMAGKVEVFGNAEHFMAALSLKKPAAKRTAKKATEEKTEKAPAKKPAAKKTTKKTTAK